MKTKFGELKPFYFWKKLPFTQWTVTDNQFKYKWEPRFYQAADPIEYTFTSTEQWMMWNKAQTFNDYDMADKILATNDARIVKALGRKIKNFRDEIWDNVKLDIVYRGNMLKFTQNLEWAEKLKQVVRDGYYFVEASPFDKVWGIGLNPEDAKSGMPWKGENLLGIVLTNVAIDLLKADQFVMYQEDVNAAGIEPTEVLQEYLKQFIDIELFPNWDALENDFSDLVSKFVEDRFAIGEFRHHH